MPNITGKGDSGVLFHKPLCTKSFEGQNLEDSIMDHTSWKTGTLRWVNCVRWLLFTNSPFLGLISDSRHGYSKLILRRLQFTWNCQHLVSSMHQKSLRLLWHVLSHAGAELSQGRCEHSLKPEGVKFMATGATLYQGEMEDDQEMLFSPLLIIR